MTASEAKAIKSEQGIILSGALVYASVSRILEQAKGFFKQHKSESFVVDCTSMDRIDSAGIALLLEWHRKSTNINSKCRFVGLSKQAQALVDAYHLKAVISA